MIHKLLNGKEDYFYTVFRIFIGLLFAQHGAQKLFGMFGGNAASAFSLMWTAGMIEFFGGLMVALGLFTRLGALLSAATMVAAYFMAHAGQGLIPIVNKGELALVYFACFLAITAFGARHLSLEKMLFKKEFF